MTINPYSSLILVGQGVSPKIQNNRGFSLITPSSMPILRAETDLKFRRYFMGIQNWSEEVILV
ncbi:MAG: hypothetical protein ACYS8S_05340, partial [Planctomycetota bacterium]